MALQLRLPFTPTSTIHSPPSWKLRYGTISPVSRTSRGGLTGGEVSRGRIVKVRSSIDTAVGQVTEVDKDTFWPLVEAAGDKTVVLDMYTQWCGPCKIIAPKFKELSEKHLDVVFMKLDCNQENRPLAKELGLRVVPTFKILKNGKIVKEVTGAKLDDIVAAIDYVRSSSSSSSSSS